MGKSCTFALHCRVSGFRDPVNGFIHLAGLLLSLIGTGAMVSACRPEGLRMLAAAIYGLTMSGCFLASTCHHLIRASREIEILLFRLDYAAIYLFIAGAYTPVCIHQLKPPGGLVLLGTVWTLAAIGIVYQFWLAPAPKSVSDPPGFWTTALYGAMGWLMVVQLPDFIAASEGGTIWLAVAGGVSYSLGGIILTRKLLNFQPGRLGHHEIWHLCVLLGAACHYGYLWINLTANVGPEV